MYTGKWLAVGKLPTRKEIVKMLRDNPGDERAAAFAVLTLEKDSLLIHDLRNTVDGLKARVTDLQKRVKVLGQIREVVDVGEDQINRGEVNGND